VVTSSAINTPHFPPETVRQKNARRGQIVTSPSRK
jgi:hypothetical protein